ncbi:hypothetical protein [Luteipulveratus flavus]|uniref:Ricin B lectin domain-containing protein n=1 Tax=Luteipulveratus flavus TaxID=3031728 RepID=A0ABT6C759_9MICO|nr:hypothetical protein [Luteipulveratus sp. YIM 133296]MDF8264725.1 hypothetical protein [Luteipulveratus sp. YIM 133296]
MSARPARRLTALALAGVTLAGAGAALTAGSASAVTLPAPGSTALGWSAAIRHASGLHDGRGTLVLVPPSGGIVTIGSVSDDAWLADVSPDGRKVITARIQAGEGLRATVWDTATKKATYFRVAGQTPGNVDLAFGGDGILLHPRGYNVQSRRIDGSFVRSWASYGEDTTPSPNGALVYQANDTRIYERNAKTGVVSRSWAVPAAYRGAERFCKVGQQWDAASVSVDCNGGGLGMDQTFRLVTATGAMTAMSPQNSAHASPTSPKRVAEVGSNCNAVGYVDQTGYHSLPGMQSEDADSSTSLSGAFSSSAYFASSSCFTDTANRWWLGKYDLTTNRVTRLAGSGTTSGGMIAQAQTIDGHH